MINVGCYKVNPLEVEDEIRKIDGIRDVQNYSKSNSLLGNIICAEVVRDRDDITETSIRLKLKIYIQEYKIPRTINFVEKLKTTRSGKSLRN